MKRELTLEEIHEELLEAIRVPSVTVSIPVKGFHTRVPV